MTRLALRRRASANAVRLSKGRLIKITGAWLVSRTPTELTCKGTGIYADGSHVLTRYRAYVDEDHQVMVAYDTAEAEENLERKAERENEAQAEQQSSAFNQAVDEAFAQDE